MTDKIAEFLANCLINFVFLALAGALAFHEGRRVGRRERPSPYLRGRAFILKIRRG